MKISKLTKQIKKNRRTVIRFYDSNHNMWIGSVSAIFPLYDMPNLNDNQILTLLDISPSEHDKFVIKNVETQQGNLIKDQIKDIIATHKNDGTLADGFLIKYLDKDLMCFNASSGIKFIDLNLLDIMDYKTEEFNMYYIKIVSDAVVIRKGLLPVAVIECYDAVSEELVNTYKKIYKLFSEAWEQKKLVMKSEIETTVNQITFEQLSEN